MRVEGSILSDPLFITLFMTLDNCNVVNMGPLFSLSLTIAFAINLDFFSSP